MGELDEVMNLSFFLGIVFALLCGAIVGVERQLKGKPVGIRTSILICLGTMTYVHLGLQLPGSSDSARVLGQIITGVGFLGAGVIMNKGGLVTGMTSAAVVWVLAAIGAAIGYGHYAWALVLALLDVAVLVGTEWLEKAVISFQRGQYKHSKRGNTNSE